MNKLMIIAVACLISGTAAAADAVSITVLKIDRESGVYPKALLSVQSPSDKPLDTLWSCVLFDGDTPVYEQETNVRNVPPHGNAISLRAIGYQGRFDKVECRLMRTSPPD